VVAPAKLRSGKEFKRYMKQHPPDNAWSSELQELRAVLVMEERTSPG